MGILAANIVTAESQAGDTVTTRAASNKTQTNGDFASELSGRLGYDSSQADPRQIKVPEGAPGTDKPANSGEPALKAAALPTGTPDLTLPPGSVDVTTTPKGNNGSPDTLNQKSAFQLTSALPQLPPFGDPKVASANGVTPNKTSSNLPPSPPAQELATREEQSVSAVDPGSASGNDATPVACGSSLPSSRQAKGLIPSQQRTETSKGILELSDAVSSTNSSRLSRSPNQPEVGTPAPLPNVIVQLGSAQSFRGTTRRSESGQSQSSKETAIGPASPSVVPLPLEPSDPVPTTTSEQHQPLDVAGPASDQADPGRGANLGKSSNGTSGAASATLSASQNAMTEVVPVASSGSAPNADAISSQNAMMDQEPSAPFIYATSADTSSKTSSKLSSNVVIPGMTGALGAPRVGRVNSRLRSPLAERDFSSTGVTTPPEAHALASDADAVDTSSSSRPNSTPSYSATKVATSLRSTTDSKLQDASSLHSPESAAPLENGPMASAANQVEAMDARPAMGPLKTARGMALKQAEAGSAGGLNIPRDPSATVIGSLVNGTSPESRNEGTQPTLTSPQDATPTAGAATPTQESASQPEIQAPASTPQSAVPPQLAGNGEFTVVSYNPAVPSDDEPIIVPVVPDDSFAPESASTKAPSSLEGSEPPGRPNRIKNLPEASKTAPGPGSDAPPITMPGTLAAAPAQSQDSEASPSVRDKRQSEASDHKDDAKTTADLTKAADANLGLAKTGSDASTAWQVGVQTQGQTGRVAPQAVVAPPDRAEPANSSLPAGYQEAVHGAVSSARLTQQAGSAEMQVRLRTETLGSIDVHTVVKGSDIGASIRVEARDTQVMMANEISRLEQALSERNLRVQRLDVLQGAVSGNQSGETGHGNYHGNPSQSRPGSASHSRVEAYPTSAETPAVYDEGSLGLSTTHINLRV